MEKGPEMKPAAECAPELAKIEAMSNELKRKDTARLEQEELEKCKVTMQDGSVLYVNSKGKLETLEERQKRLSHNSYVAFQRSLESGWILHSVLFSLQEASTRC